MIDSQHNRAILEARARDLARPVLTAEQSPGTPVLNFSLGRERFAIESRYVLAVFPLTDLVPLPGATRPVLGLTRWRGDVLTILDVRQLVGSATSAPDDLGRVIVVGRAAPEFGVLADIVHDITAIEPASLHAVSDARRVDASVLLGVTGTAIHMINAPALIARQADAHSTVEAAVQSSSATTQ